MYIATVALLLIVFPVASIVADKAIAHTAIPWLALLGKWFVFWTVGIRLIAAGLRQFFQPRFTAKEILAIESDAALPVVQELGIANFSVGIVAALSLVFSRFILPMAIAGALFYGIAGIRHLRDPHRNTKQNFAMVTDLFAAAVLVAYIAYFAAA
jgi:hypothetical protein